MIATKTGMAKYSTQELINYVERTDKKVKAVPASIRRNSFPRWNSNSAAICAEIQNRQGFAAHKVAATYCNPQYYFVKSHEKIIWKGFAADAGDAKMIALGWRRDR
jgi:hypothetical protein|tara:strand:- start:490 stop:807 length:318 start_codon:yes stop_codon:yes gene_type:complete